MLIEITGPDGSGKSTLIDRVRRHIHETTPAKAYERVLRSESRNLLESVSLAGEAEFEQRDVELARLLDLVRSAHADLHVYRGDPSSHAFVSFYRCAALAGLHRRGLGFDAGLRALLRRVPPPDLSFRLRIEPELALQRITGRAKGDQVLLVADVPAELARLVASFETAGGALDYPQYVLDGDSDLGTHTTTVSDLLAATCRF